MLKKDKQQIQIIIKSMQKADKAYWNANGHSKQIMTDGQWDTLYEKLKDYYHKYPKDKAIINYFSHMPHSQDNTFAKIKHPYHVISLAKIRHKKEIEHFLNKWTTDKNALYYTDGFLVQPKEDGLSTVIYFNDKNMPHKITFLTRGSGVYGNDVTNEIYHYNLMNIRQIAKRVGNRHVVIRGESLISRKDFEKDSHLDKTGFENERNLVSGSVMNKNPRVAGQRGVFLSAYSLLNRDEFKATLPTELSQLKFMRDLGFSVTTNTHYFPNTEQGKNDLLHFILDFSHTQRLAIGHDIDGLVIKPNYTVNFDQIGWTKHNPRYADAYKFPSQQGLTRVKTIKYQVSANGKLTPVIIFTHPVHLFGATISKCTGSSVGNMEKNHIMINGFITVKRMNDVIPKAYGNQSLNTIIKDLKAPTATLPSDSIKNGKFYYLPKNKIKNSLPVLVNRWSKFVSKPCLNIQGLSDKVLSIMMREHLIDPHDFSSLWKIDKKKFLQTKGFALKGWQRLQKQLKKAKTTPLPRIMLGLPIDNAGLSAFVPICEYISKFSLRDGNLTFPEVLPKHYHFRACLKNTNLQFALANGLINNIPKIKGLGNATLPIINSLFRAKMIKQLQRLTLYLDMKDVPVQTKQTSHSSKITGLNFVITGKLSKPRKYFKQMITKYGGHLKSGISSKVNYLICNQQSNSSKYKKAVQKNIPIINEQQFIKLLKA